MMNAEIKAQWLTDLRSGEFQKGKGYLQRDGKFCCLGVLCEQAVKAGIVTSRQIFDGSTLYVSVSDAFDQSASVLPQCVADWAGLTGWLDTTNPRVRATMDGPAYNLSSINDNDDEYQKNEYTFAQIADMIERDL